jgi:DNA-binding transcriptional LysR family regulator
MRVRAARPPLRRLDSHPTGRKTSARALRLASARIDSEPAASTRPPEASTVRRFTDRPSAAIEVLVLPSNEAVLTAVRRRDCATALSEGVVAPLIESGQLKVLDIALPPRQFTILRHKERDLTAAATATAFEALCRASAKGQN